MTILLPKQKEETTKTTEAKDTFDIKCAWLVSLQNMVIALSRLRSQCPTICPSMTDEDLESAIASMSGVIAEIEALESKLMDTWGINHIGVMRWMGLELEDYRRRMDPSVYSISRSGNLHHGRTKKSRKK